MVESMNSLQERVDELELNQNQGIPSFPMLSVLAAIVLYLLVSYYKKY